MPPGGYTVQQRENIRRQMEDMAAAVTANAEAMDKMARVMLVHSAPLMVPFVQGRPMVARLVDRDDQSFARTLKRVTENYPTTPTRTATRTSAIARLGFGGGGRHRA